MLLPGEGAEHHLGGHLDRRAVLDLFAIEHGSIALQGVGPLSRGAVVNVTVVVGHELEEVPADGGPAEVLGLFEAECELHQLVGQVLGDVQGVELPVTVSQLDLTHAGPRLPRPIEQDGGIDGAHLHAHIHGLIDAELRVRLRDDHPIGLDSVLVDARVHAVGVPGGAHGLDFSGHRASVEVDAIGVHLAVAHVEQVADVLRDAFERVLQIATARS